jgi:ribonuclease HI
LVANKQDLESVVMFTDGACSGNPGPGGWAAIVVFPEGHVVELGGGDASTTNNQMEMLAVIKGLESAKAASQSVVIYTDSTYVIRGITQWVWGWRQRGWLTAEGQPVANRELWEELVRLTSARTRLGGIDWRYVRGHTGVPGNERVDEIAVAYTKGQRANLYRGPLLKYPVAIHDLPDNTDLPEMRPKQAKQAAHCYLSLVDGVPMRHATWAECERRVKGRSGARFKKALSEADAAAILRSWGVSL